MQIPHYALTLNVNAQTGTQAIIAKQYDNKSRYIDIVLVADNKPIVLNKERVTLTAYDKKAKETIAVTNCTIVDGVIVAELTASVLSVATTLDCEITVYGTNKEIITSARFSCIVDSKLSTEVAERTQDFSALQTALADVASTSNRIDEVSSRTQPVTLGGTGAATSLEAAKNLQNAYIGVATAIPENSDLDTYTTIGTYDIAHASIATLSNSPFSAHSYKLYVIACGASSYIYQLAVSPYYGEICIRDYNSTTKAWASWNKIVSQPSATDETGTWTPSVDTGTITVTNANYVYRGNTVTITATIVIGDDITGTSITLNGLPVATTKVGATDAYIHGSSAVIAFASIINSRILVKSDTSLAGKTLTVTGTYIIL